MRCSSGWPCSGSSRAFALPARRHDLGEVSVAAGLGLVLLTVMALGSGRRVWGPAVRLMPFVFFVVIALLRDATGGSSSGSAPLVLFPVLWLALYERRALWWLMATLCAWLTLVLPLIVVGAPDYHSGDWRRALFLAAFAALLCWAVRRWRDRPRASDHRSSDRRAQSPVVGRSAPAPGRAGQTRPQAAVGGDRRSRPVQELQRHPRTSGRGPAPRGRRPRVGRASYAKATCWRATAGRRFRSLFTTARETRRARCSIGFGH